MSVVGSCKSGDCQVMWSPDRDRSDLKRPGCLGSEGERDMASLARKPGLRSVALGLMSRTRWRTCKSS